MKQNSMKQEYMKQGNVKQACSSQPGGPLKGAGGYIYIYLRIDRYTRVPAGITVGVVWSGLGAGFSGDKGCDAVGV